MTSDIALSLAGHEALRACAVTLQPIAAYTLEPAIDRWMCALAEQKEYLSEEEHAELMALVAFTQRRTIDKLQASLALRQLRAAFPWLVEASGDTSLKTSKVS